MKIKEVEQRVGITSQNIRFYEREGLIDPLRNEENNYREYSEADIYLLERIKILRVLGLPIPDIKSIIEGELTLDAAIHLHMAELERQEQEIKGTLRACSKIVAGNISFAALNENLFEDEAEMVAQRLPMVFREDITKQILTKKQMNFTVTTLLTYGYHLNAVLSYIFGDFLLNYKGQGVHRGLGEIFLTYDHLRMPEFALDILVMLAFIIGYVGIYMSSSIKIQLICIIL